MTDRQQKLIDEVMDNFNFAKVATAMRAVGWEWANGKIDDDGRYLLAIPDERRIREVARQQLRDAIDGHGTNLHCCSSGGFEAFYDVATGDLSLEFCLAAYGTEKEKAS